MHLSILSSSDVIATGPRRYYSMLRDRHMVGDGRMAEPHQRTLLQQHNKETMLRKRLPNVLKGLKE